MCITWTEAHFESRVWEFSKLFWISFYDKMDLMFCLIEKWNRSNLDFIKSAKMCLFLSFLLLFHYSTTSVNNWLCVEIENSTLFCSKLKTIEIPKNALEKFSFCCLPSKCGMQAKLRVNSMGHCKRNGNS